VTYSYKHSVGAGGEKTKRYIEVNVLKCMW